MRAAGGHTRGTWTSSWQFGDTRRTLCPAPGPVLTRIIHNGQSGDAVLHEDAQGHVDGGAGAHHGDVAVGADPQLLQRLGHELGLGDLCYLQGTGRGTVLTLVRLPRPGPAALPAPDACGLWGGLGQGPGGENRECWVQSRVWGTPGERTGCGVHAASWGPPSTQNAARGTEAAPAPVERILGRDGTYKELEELEDAFVGEDVERVPRVGVDDGQTMDLIPDQGGDGVEEAAGPRESGNRGSPTPRHRRSRVPLPAALEYLALGEMQTKGLKESCR